MLGNLTEEEIARIKARVAEIKLEHYDLDQIIERLAADPTFEELHIKRLKKRKLLLRDQLARLEDDLIPDILA